MTEQQKKEYTWEDLVASVGQDFSGGLTLTGADPVERSMIRLFCEPIEMDCPLHHDDEIARQHGYRGIIAPVSMINQTLTTPPIWQPGQPSLWTATDADARDYRAMAGIYTMPLPKPPTTAVFATDIEIEYVVPVYLGDVLTKKGRKLVSVNVDQTSVGFGAFMVFESEILNQKGELVAIQRNGQFSYNPHPKEKGGK